MKFKNQLAVIFAVALLGTCGSVAVSTNAMVFNPVQASASTSGTYTASGYTLSYTVSGSEITITGFTKTSSASTVSVVIPSYINGYSVTSIGAYAFYGKSISAVIIPDTVVSLGNYSFSNCSSLISVTLSKNLSTASSGGYLFYNSLNIETVNIPEDMADPSFIDHFSYHTNTVIQGNVAKSGYTLGYTVSDGEAEITSFTKTSSASAVAVSIPSTINGFNVASIGNLAFYCKAISSVDIPDTVVSLGDYSFSGCTSLKTVTLSKNLTSASSGGYLFYNSLNIETVHAPADMTDPTFIDHFNYHTDTVIEVTSGTTQYSLNYTISIADNDAAITKYTAKTTGNITVTIPDMILGKKVTTIGESSFNGSNVYQVIMSDNITTVESWAFSNCTNLKKLTVSMNVSNELSGGYLFNGCNNLTDITVSSNMVDKNFISHFQYCVGGAKLIKPEVDAKVTAIYNSLKNSSSNVNWNIGTLTGNSRENAKYQVAKYIHSQLAGNLITYDSTYSMHQTAYSLVAGKGACAGMSRSYILLLLKSGFTSDEVQLISAPQHALVGIKLYDQWYFVECTDSFSKSFGMTYQNEWYNGTPEGEYDGYTIPSTYTYYCDADGTRVVNAESETYLAERYKSNYNRGDVNMDGVTNSSDYSALNSYLSGASVSINLLNADVNYDGTINSSDLSLIDDIVDGRTTFAAIIYSVYERNI